MSVVRRQIPVQGVSQGTLSNDPVDAALLAAATGIAWAFALELNITIFLTFKRRRGLYFWSLLACSWGLSIHALAFILKFLVGSPWLVYLPFVEIGWVLMVTGQALVLYSRLHLVVLTQKTLRYVLWLIIFDAVALHIPTIVLTYGSNDPYAPATWAVGFNIMERIQLAGFCAQEFVISGIYLWSVVRVFKSIQHASTRKVMIQLITINALCIGMDIVLIGLEYSNRYIGEASLKPMIYAIKLKLEFVVLNQLVNLTLAGRGSVSRPVGGEHELESYDATAATAANPSQSRKPGIRNSFQRLKHGPQRPVWPLSQTVAPASQTDKPSTHGVARDDQRPRVDTGFIVSISANDQPKSGSKWTRTMKRAHNGDRNNSAGEKPRSGIVRAQTTVITSDAIGPTADSGSNSSSREKILPVLPRDA